MSGVGSSACGLRSISLTWMPRWAGVHRGQSCAGALWAACAIDSELAVWQPCGSWFGSLTFFLRLGPLRGLGLALLTCEPESGLKIGLCVGPVRCLGLRSLPP